MSGIKALDVTPRNVDQYLALDLLNNVLALYKHNTTLWNPARLQEASPLSYPA